VALVGGHGDEYQAAINRFATAAGIGARVRIEPWSDRPATWYRAADVVVCASDDESLPGVVLEAMALRVPVVASRAFGIPEVVEDGVTGYLCDPSDVASLADALRRALDAPDRERAAITDGARRRIEDRHDAPHRADAVWALLGEIGARTTEVSDPAG
jgi:glycosyltransferase involved in cell wall biosynthesis